jgi:hypothetical protein
LATNAINPVGTQQSGGSVLLIAVFLLPLSLISFLIFAFDRGPDFLAFGTMAICFLGLAAIFLQSNGSIITQWYTASGFMTLLAALEFVAIPFSRFINGDDQIDEYYLRAIVYLLLGFSAFWLACWILKKPNSLSFAPEFRAGHPRVLFAVSVLFVCGTTADIILWKLGAIGYEATTMRYTADISAVGALTTAGQSLEMAMLVSGIEVLGKHSKSLGIRLIFVSSFILTLGFGLISGMKFEVLMPLFTLAVLLGITRKRMPRFVWALPLLYLGLQPFVLAYRMNLNAGYGAQIGTIDGLTSTMAKSAEDAIGEQSSLAGAHRSAFETAGARLSVLTLFHNVLQLPSPDLLNGDETVWLAPIYPFIPRPLWKNKPIFNKGQRMSEALGIGRVSSTNVPGIADLYALGGTVGIVSGMFIWGACVQLFMNSVRGGLTERGTFLYVLLLFPLTNLERDIVASIGGAVETACILMVFSKLIYGGPLFSMRSGLPRVAS